jgi:hypothetical protein
MDIGRRLADRRMSYRRSVKLMKHGFALLKSRCVPVKSRSRKRRNANRLQNERQRRRKLDLQRKELSWRQQRSVNVNYNVNSRILMKALLTRRVPWISQAPKTALLQLPYTLHRQYL